MIPVIGSLLFFLSLPAHSAVVDYKPLALETKAGDRVLVRGFDGDVRFIPATGKDLVVKVRQDNPDNAAPELKQTVDEWNFSLQRTEEGIQILVQSLHTKEIWRQILRSSGVPKFHLTISAPASLAIDMVWRSGRVTVDNWNGPVHVSLQEGSIHASGGRGDIQAIGGNVEISLKQKSGSVVAESYDGKTVLDEIKGSIEAENFTGDLTVQKSEGQVSLHTFKAPMVVNAGKGRIEFETVRGPVKVSGFSGDLKGVTDEASVTAKLLDTNEVRIQSNTGPVVLNVPNSGAQLSLSSAEGSVTGPPHLRAEQLAGQRVLRGRMRGSLDGSIVVRSQSGSVRVQ